MSVGGEVLQASGLKLGLGTMVDATIIGAPSSTKNASKQRDPEMHQTCKGQQWHFGMKLHIGVDSATGLAHSALVTAASVRDTANVRQCTDTLAAMPNHPDQLAADRRLHAPRRGTPS